VLTTWSSELYDGTRVRIKEEAETAGNNAEETMTETVTEPEQQ